MTYAIIVDDEPHILRVAELSLKTIGCEVLTARDGEQAWKAIQKRCPDILVTDVQMPKIDGIQLVQLVRESPALADMPILLLTAKGIELSLAESDLVQSCTIVSKPFSPSALARQTYRMLTKSAAS